MNSSMASRLRTGTGSRRSIPNLKDATKVAKLKGYSPDEVSVAATLNTIAPPSTAADIANPAKWVPVFTNPSAGYPIDPYWHLAEDAPIPLAALAPRHVFYVATLSKVISPGLRTAFVQCPSAAHAEAMTAALRATRLMGHPLVSALASQLLLDGSAQSLLALVRTEARERMRMARYLLAPSLLQRAEGLHAWCRIPAPWTDATLVRTAQLQGLAIDHQ